MNLEGLENKKSHLIAIKKFIDENISVNSLAQELKNFLNSDKKIESKDVQLYFDNVQAKIISNKEQGYAILYEEIIKIKSFFNSCNSYALQNYISYLNNLINENEFINIAYFNLYTKSSLTIEISFKNMMQGFKDISVEHIKLLTLYYLLAKVLIDYDLTIEQTLKLNKIEIEKKIFKNLSEEKKSLIKNGKIIYNRFVEKSDEVEELENTIKNLEDLKAERDTLKKFMDSIMHNESHLFADYIFGDRPILYRSMYNVLKYNAVLDNGSTFAFFLYKHTFESEKITNRKLLLVTHPNFTARLIGYFLFKLKEFLINNSIISETYDFIKWVHQVYEVKIRQKGVKPFPERYILNIVKEDNLKPKELEIKDQIDECFSKFYN